jgi:predicted site-specific integrase-resolvase
MSFVKLNKAVELLGLHPNTLRRFADNGTIKAIKTPGGQRLYDVASYTGTSKLPVTVCYCRVSSSKQRADLDKQIAYMRGLYPQAEIITDIASGLNSFLGVVDIARKENVSLVIYSNTFSEETILVLKRLMDVIKLNASPN